MLPLSMHSSTFFKLQSRTAGSNRIIRVATLSAGALESPLPTEPDAVQVLCNLIGK